MTELRYQYPEQSGKIPTRQYTDGQKQPLVSCNRYRWLLAGLTICLLSFQPAVAEMTESLPEQDLVKVYQTLDRYRKQRLAAPDLLKIRILNEKSDLVATSECRSEYAIRLDVELIRAIRGGSALKQGDRLAVYFRKIHHTCPTAWQSHEQRLLQQRKLTYAWLTCREKICETAIGPWGFVADQAFYRHYLAVQKKYRQWQRARQMP